MRDGSRVLVIGGGMAGLAASIDLARRGAAVTLLERAPSPGGKVRQSPAGVDAGPTVMTMRWVLDELLDAAGVDAGAVVRLARAEVLARHAWGGDRLDLLADRAASADAIGRFAGAAEARGYLAFCERARRIHEAVDLPFLRSQRPGVARMLRELPRLLAIDPMRSLWRMLGDHFRDPRLRQLFGRYATYTGSSPFEAPATLAVIAHVEQQGVWLVEGGMIALARGLEAVARSLGVEVRCGADVKVIAVANGRFAGVVLATGERIEGEAVVVNADPSAIGAGLLGAAVSGSVRALAPRRRSLSAVTWTGTARTSFRLSRHTIFFSSDYAREFREILKARRLPDEPTVYVCAQDRDDRGHLEAHGPERLLVLVNAPPEGDLIGAREIEACLDRTLALLRRSGMELTEARLEATGPADFERMFPGTGGALYGPASHGPRAAFLRPGARTRIPGLYLAGGAAHPGPGVPMAMLSGRRAAEAIAEDLPSISRSRPAATRGGTSTRSPPAAMGSR